MQFTIFAFMKDNLYHIRKFISYFYFIPLLASCSNCPEKLFHVEVDGLDMLVSERGPENGRPVVLMHGNGGSHKSMVTQQLQLARKGYRVICPDSRGQGANAPLEEYHYADMAEDCYRLINKLGLEKPVVGGWSGEKTDGG